MSKIVHKPDIEAIKTSGVILIADVRKLRSEVFADGVISADEADILFELNDHCDELCPEWPVFFIESLTDFLVHQVSPRGYISEENAGWLIRRISHDGKLESATELELLVNVIEKANSCPASLVTFALAQVKGAVLEGNTLLRRGKALTPGVIGAPEVELIRRILYAFGGDGHIAITRPEAEMLFELNDATIEEKNSPLWSDLFVKGIANYLMAHSGYAVPSRHQALKREGWLEGRRGTGGFLAEMKNVRRSDFSSVLISGLRDIFNIYHRPENETAKARNAAYEQGVSEAQIIDAHEASWLIENLERDKKLHRNEKALLSFIREECPDIHPSLSRYVSRA